MGLHASLNVVYFSPGMEACDEIKTVTMYLPFLHEVARSHVAGSEADLGIRISLMLPRIWLSATHTISRDRYAISFVDTSWPGFIPSVRNLI